MSTGGGRSTSPAARRPLPFAPEVGVGGPPWLPPMSVADQESVTLGLLAAGVRALSFYMVVDRERWYGAPISGSGAARTPAPWLQRLLSVLAEVDWPGLRRRAPIALVLSRADARHGVASSIADPVTPVVAEFLGLGPAGNAELSRDPGAAEHRRWTAAVEEALSLAQIPYDLVDEESPIERFGGYRAIVMPTLDRVDRAAWRRLHEVAARGQVVVIGPRKPSRDEHDQPLGADSAPPKRVGLIREGSRDDLAGLAQDLAGLAGELPDVWIAGEADGVDVSPFENASGVVRVVFVANRTAAALVADIVVPEGLRLRDPLAHEAMHHRTPDMVDVPLQPHQVRLLIVEGEPL
jgi:beta-galactosidase